MSFHSQRSSESVKLSYLFNPSVTLSSEKDAHSANFSTISTSSQGKFYSSFNGVFEETSRDDSMVYRRDRDVLLSNRQRRSDDATDTSYSDLRLTGGETKPLTCKYQPPADFITKCKHKNQCAQIQQPPTTKVTVINVELKHFKRLDEQYDDAQCQYFVDPRKRMRIKIRGTQTLYRESSAQTLPFLPGVSNNEQELDSLELFKLPTILPGDGPPGLYEVEVLERARKRWAFTKALKANFKRQLEECKENISSPQKGHVIEAFEWENWMEREEHIQECQMLRLELVIRMFENREKKMHEASRSRIGKSMQIIQAKRDAGLRKNEIEYGRQLRRLDMQRLKIPRNWRKENITTMLDDPSSEFYAPQMRYGVNPNRRHFVAERKAFDASIDELEKKAVNMNKLVCRFAKLKEWSKPKLRLKEVEQNFCTDVNLKKLYDSLKKLRQECGRHKMMPKCLKEKAKVSAVEPQSYQDDMPVPFFNENLASSAEDENQEIIDEEEEMPRFEVAMATQEAKERQRSQQLDIERRAEELEAMLEEYEGSTVGWLMKFLSDEMHRLEEQRNLHFFTMLAQKERWRREAAEAGLRQKENDMRIIYEEVFQKSNEANIEVCSEYLGNVMEVDTKDYAEQKATTSIVNLAKVIDEDIQHWLDSIKSVQNPLNYQMLRYLLKDLIFPNVDVLVKRYESELIIYSIINDDLFPHVYKLLEPYDVSFNISNDLVDRLIDNDLYFFSDDSSGSSITVTTQQEHEARAILRKLIRRAVPGRRWMTPNERFVDGNIGDLLDEVFDKLQIKEQELQKLQKLKHINYKLSPQGSYLNLVNKRPTAFDFNDESNSDEFTCFMNSNIYEEQVKVQSNLSESDRAVKTNKSDLSTDKLRNYAEAMPDSDHMESPTTDQIHLRKGPKKPKTDLENKETLIFLQKIIADVVKGFIPAEEEEEEELAVTDGFEELQNIEQSKEETYQESEEDIQAALHLILRKVFKSVAPETSSEVESESITHFEEMELEYEEEDQFQLVVNESELELMEVIRCKCKTEIERENYIRKLLKQGRVKIIRKPRFEEAISFSESSFHSIETFDYESISTSSPQRNVLATEGDTQTDDLHSQFDKPTDITEAELEEIIYYEQQCEAVERENIEITENAESAKTGERDEEQQPIVEAVNTGLEEDQQTVEDVIDKPPRAEEHADETKTAVVKNTVDHTEPVELKADIPADVDKVEVQEVAAVSIAAEMPTNETVSEVPPEVVPDANLEDAETNAENPENEEQ